MSPPELTQERLRSLLRYDRVSGVFTWRVSPCNCIRKGAVAGTFKVPNGYRAIAINKRVYLEHRLAFLYVTGSWPAAEVDHIDRCKFNNAWTNLREASRSENVAYARTKPNRHGLKGVRKDSDETRFSAAIRVDGKTTYLGRFDTAEQAHQAYRRAAAYHFGPFASFDQAGYRARDGPE